MKNKIIILAAIALACSANSLFAAFGGLYLPKDKTVYVTEKKADQVSFEAAKTIAQTGEATDKDVKAIKKAVTPFHYFTGIDMGMTLAGDVDASANVGFRKDSLVVYGSVGYTDMQGMFEGGFDSDKVRLGGGFAWEF